MFSLTVVAMTGKRFSGFAPYVASVNDAGLVAFRAALRGGGSAVFAGDGGEVEELISRSIHEGVTSHPDLNNARDASFYGDLARGGQGAFLYREGRLQILAEAHDAFASIGPLGPTMNEAGTVAFRGDLDDRVSGIFTSDGTAVTAVADTSGPLSRFHGLPVIIDDGTVVFRADRKDGVQGIYAGRGGLIRTVAETGERFESLGLFPSANERGIVAFTATLRGEGCGVFNEDNGRITCIA